MEDKINEVLFAWENLTPEKTFSGLTLPEFKARLQPSLSARDQIGALENQLLAMQIQRQNADRESNQLILSVVSSVKGDLEHGEDSSLYQDMVTSAKVSARAA